MTDVWGVKCNVAVARSYGAPGALCWVMSRNPGWGGERIQVLMRSRGGRLIEVWLATKYLTNFRAAWQPKHLLLRCVMAAWETREAAQRWAEEVSAAHAAPGVLRGGAASLINRLGTFDSSSGDHEEA